MTSGAGEAFWGFSLAFYGAEAAQAACLALQDRHGGDVNIALYLLWRAAAGERLVAEDVAALDAAVADWRAEVVRPLRSIRRHLKGGALGVEPAKGGAFRNEIRRLELSAEKLQQESLAALAPPLRGTAPPSEAAAAHLALYAVFLRADPRAEAFAALRDRFDALLAGDGEAGGRGGSSGPAG